MRFTESSPLLGHPQISPRKTRLIVCVLIAQIVALITLPLIIIATTSRPTATNFASIPQSVNDSPVIGIMTQPQDDVVPKDGWPPGKTAYLPSSYQKWVEAAGGRAVVIPYDLPFDQLKMLFQGINGLLIPGGDQDLYFNHTFVQAADFLFSLALDANRNGDYFPVWGTCMGMQLLTIMISRNDSILLRDTFDSENISLKLDLTQGVESGRIIGPNTPHSVFNTFAHEAVTANFHHDGVTPSNFISNPRLHSFARIIATNYDRKNLPFVSVFEGRELPFYGVQFHPEATLFSHASFDSVNHTPEAIRAMQYLANFFLGEARRNHHPFTPNITQYLLNQYNVSFHQAIYFF